METVWTVSEAKARLSEILRRSETDGPQRIGTRRRYVVMPEEDWRAMAPAAAKPSLGQFILHHMPRIDDLELPSREDPQRPIPFADETDDPA